MSDFNSSLPVRTQNNGDVVVNIADGTTETQKLAVDASGRITTKMDDGNGNAVTSQANGAQRALDVGIDVSGVQIDPRQIRALTSADVVTVQQGTTPWVDNISQIGGSALSLGQTTMSASIPVVIASNQSAINVLNTADGSVSGGTAGTQSLLAGGVYNSTALTLTTGQQAALQLDSSGNLKVDLATSLPAGTNSIGNIGTVSAVTAITNALPSGTNIIGKVEITDGTNVAGVAPASTAATATQPAEVVALSPNTSLPAGTNLLGGTNVYVGGSAASPANPVPVSITSASSGTPIQSYLTSASVAAGASATLTYTVPATHSFSLERVWISSEARISAQIQYGASTSTPTYYMSFNSSANPNIDLTVTAPPTLTAGQVVNVVITNNDVQASNVYATIEGNQVS